MTLPVMFADLSAAFGVTVLRYDAERSGYLCHVHNPVPPDFWTDLEDYIHAKCYGTRVELTPRGTQFLVYFVIR